MTTTVIGNNTGYTVGIVDTHIQQNTPTTNFGTVASFNCQSATSGQITRALMKFTGLTSISGPVSVSSAVLTLRNRDAAASSRTLQVRRLLSAFDELQASWNNRLTGTAWATAGVLGGSDVDASILATGTMPTASETNFTVSGASLAQYVQDVINGVIVDHGLLLNVIDDTTTFDSIPRRIGAKDNATAAIRPYLTVTYTVITPPNITVDDISVNNLSGTATFTISLNASFASPVTVYGKTTDDTATSPDDFTALPLELVTFAPGETTKTVEVTLVP